MGFLLNNYKNKKKYFASSLLILGLFSFAFLPGCKVGYSFSGAAIPPEAKTVSVQYFQNNASLAPPTLSQTFTEALRDKLSSQTRLALANKGGDLAFEGSIIGYATAPIAIQSTDQAALNRLTITVNVKYTCAFDEKKNFEQSFSRFFDYTSTQSLAAVEDQLIRDINEQLVQDIFNKALNDW
ncbi:MAG: LptE family protein [Bacteroidota bacterium]